MSDRIFLDTNILVYAHSDTEPAKKKIVETIIEKHEKLVISTQVLNEFINVMHKKRGVPLKMLVAAIRELSENFTVVQITVHTIEQALHIASQHNYSYFDSLMLSAALEHNCSIIYTEDMHHTHTLNTLKIQNPFR
jgi:predicted nucleic acid-binding protein